jgi:hypothetical protein
VHHQCNTAEQRQPATEVLLVCGACYSNAAVQTGNFGHEKVLEQSDPTTQECRIQVVTLHVALTHNAVDTREV